MLAVTFRLYEPDVVGADGYPAEWHATLKHEVRAEAGHRCVRCHHPYRKGEHGNGEWSACDRLCDHGPPRRSCTSDEPEWHLESEWGQLPRPQFWREDIRVEAQWRILTVHHLNGHKNDCRWWNLAALCQRCHLTIQGRVKMEREWPWEHSEWFKPYVAGFYAATLLGEELSRAEVESRMDELLDLGGNTPRLFR